MLIHCSEGEGFIIPLPAFSLNFEKKYETKKKEHRIIIDKREEKLYNLYDY